MTVKVHPQTIDKVKIFCQMKVKNVAKLDMKLKSSKLQDAGPYKRNIN